MHRHKGILYIKLVKLNIFKIGISTNFKTFSKRYSNTLEHSRFRYHRVWLFCENSPLFAAEFENILKTQKSSEFIRVCEYQTPQEKGGTEIYSCTYGEIQEHIENLLNKHEVKYKSLSVEPKHYTKKDKYIFNIHQCSAEDFCKYLYPPYPQEANLIDNILKKHKNDKECEKHYVVLLSEFQKLLQRNEQLKEENQYLLSSYEELLKGINYK